jgi:AcrR family transcriptional regulator
MEMSQKDTPTREKILVATLNLIGREGIRSLTTRKIAKEAGVNSAAVNYYFGTKEMLVDLALKQSLNEMSTLPEEILDIEDMEPKERLKEFFLAMLEGIYNYPGITKAHLYGPLYESDYSALFVEQFNLFLDDLFGKIKRMETKFRDEELKIAIVQTISALIIPALMPEIYKNFSKIDFKDPEIRRHFIEILIDRYYK